MPEKKRVSSTPEEPTAKKIRRTLDAYPDRIDIRDWFYKPSLVSLPDQAIHCHAVPKILDQGQEGACTGFALAAVINFLLSERGLKKSVSPRMLYELARRYDEWPGEQYDGSSARGAMKGWVRHGVCEEELWKHDNVGLDYFTPTVERESLKIPGGAFYRVMHRQVRDMHAAVVEAGALYCTLMVHAGWRKPSESNKLSVNYLDNRGNQHAYELPIIKRKGKADGGHAVAIVGYTREGFIIQNSWGEDWGYRGFALLPYDDYLIHAVDVWVAQIGVPVSTNLWMEEKWADTTAGISRVEETMQLSDVRRYVVDVGNNGELSRTGNYWTTPKDVENLFYEIIPEATKRWKKKRILLYLHSGLKSEEKVAKKALAFREVMLANQIYPVHIMWETGVMERLKDRIADLFSDVDDQRDEIKQWLKKAREGLTEAKDRTFELTISSSGKALWEEMKENARLASFHEDGIGAMQIIREKADNAVMSLSPSQRKKWELHVVGHSAGSIFIGHALRHLCELELPFVSLQLLAPAISIQDFLQLYYPLIESDQAPRPSLYLMNDESEREDIVGPYGKSLLYMVSNAFEDYRETPLLGMERYIRSGEVWRDDKLHPDVKKLFAKQLHGHPSLIVTGERKHVPTRSNSSSHEGFDSDPDTLNSVMWRILGEEPRRLFKKRDVG